MSVTARMEFATPSTGFPDLEAKIAFGLAWVVGQAGDVDELDYVLEPHPSFYLLKVTGQGRLDTVEKLAEAINTAFREVAARYLAAESLYYLPGIQAKYRENYRSVGTAADEVSLKPEFIDARLEEVYGFSQAGLRRLAGRLPSRDKMCSHDLPAFGGSLGLVLGVSSHAGKPYKRDAAGNRYNLGLCSICGSMAVLGTTWASFRGLAGPRGRPNQQVTLIMDLIPTRPLERKDLEALFAAQKDAEGAYLGPTMPVGLAPLLFLARFPQSAEIVKCAQAGLHVTRFDPGARGQERMAGQDEVPAAELAGFIVHSPFNAATVENLVDARRDAISIEGLEALVQAVTASDKRKRLEGMARLAREYHQFTAVQNGQVRKGGLYPITFETLVEVIQVSDAVRENRAVISWARVLRYFANQGNYGFVDAVRTAKDIMALRDALVRCNRQYLSEYKKQSKDAPKRMPRPLLMEEVQQLWGLMDNNELRPELQLYVAAAALTREPRAAESSELTPEPTEWDESEVPEEVEESVEGE